MKTGLQKSLDNYFHNNYDWDRFRVEHLEHRTYSQTGGSIHDRTDRSILYCRDCKKFYCSGCMGVYHDKQQKNHYGCPSRTVVKIYPEYYRLVYGDKLVEVILDES